MQLALFGTRKSYIIGKYFASIEPDGRMPHIQSLCMEYTPALLAVENWIANNRSNKGCMGETREHARKILLQERIHKH